MITTAGRTRLFRTPGRDSTPVMYNSAAFLTECANALAGPPPSNNGPAPSKGSRLLLS